MKKRTKGFRSRPRRRGAERKEFSARRLRYMTSFAYRQRLKISHLAYLYGQSLGEWATQLVYM